MNHFVLIIATISVSVGVLLFVLGVILNPNYIIVHLVFVISLIVANVPEALQGTLTVLLALTAKRMAEKNVLIKKLDIIETLGSTALILELIWFAILFLLTNFKFPAISLTYEHAEPDIMHRPPRSEPMITFRMIAFSYLIMGAIEVCAEYFAYFTVMAEFGFIPSMLIGISHNGYFLKQDRGSVMDALGRVHTFEDQLNILGTVQATVWLSIVICQFSNLLVCKTRRSSLFQQGMRNRYLNFSYLTGVCIILVVIYVPYIGSDFFGTRPIPFTYWLFGLPFAFLIFIIDELKKMIIRMMPGSWFERYLGW